MKVRDHQRRRAADIRVLEELEIGLDLKDHQPVARPTLGHGIDDVELLDRIEHPEQGRRDDVGHQHGERDAEEHEVSGHAVELRRLEGLLGQGAQAGQEQDGHERRVDPDIDQHHGQQRRGRGGGPAEIGQADQTDQIAQDPEIGIGHELPHQRRNRGCDHQRQHQGDAHGIVEPGGTPQQQRYAQPQQQLHANGQRGIGKRDTDGVPEGRVGQEVEIVLVPDDAPRHREGEVIALQRVPDRRAERHQNADADQERRQAEDIRQKPPAEGPA